MACRICNLKPYGTSLTSCMLSCHVLCRAVLCCAGKRVSDVAPKLAAAVEPFGVNLVEGVMSHIMKQVRDRWSPQGRGGVVWCRHPNVGERQR